MGHSRFAVFFISVVLVGAGAVALLLHQPGNDLPVVSARPPQAAPAMCPWRDPTGDMALFFPTATRYQTETVALSRYRLAIIKRLGPETPLESNALYVNRIYRGESRVGSVIVRRVSGQYGAVEVAVAADEQSKVVGVRIQREREPKETADVIRSSRWLGSFTGKNAESNFSLGEGIPDVSGSPRFTASAIARGIRGLLIELSEGSSGAAGHVH